MKRSSKNLQKSPVKPTREQIYKQWIVEQLDKHNVRVHRWRKFDWDETYYAYFDSRRVKIPIPECRYSLLIALHEIGHIVKGERTYGYLAEYHAEKWALHTAKSEYGITYKRYEQSAKVYVYTHLLEDIIIQHLPIKKIKPKVLKWIGVTIPKIERDVLKLKIARDRRLSK